MKLPSNRYELFVLFCRLYIGIGIVCLSVGLYMFYVNSLTGSPPYKMMGPIAFVLSIFGVLRIAVSLRALHYSKKKRQQSQQRTSEVDANS